MQSLLIVAVTAALLITLATPSAIGPQRLTSRHILATVLMFDSQVLPARVLFRSARVHTPALTRVAFVAPTEISPRSLSQLYNDGVQVIALPSPKPSHTYTHLFSAYQFERVLYLSPTTLVRADISSLLSCPVLCAAFLTPCSFSPDVMVITPNSTTAARIHPSSCTDDGLDAEACALNAAFGSEMLTAPLFDARNAGAVGMRRLALGFHTPHHLFYPRMRFEVAERAGERLRVVNFGYPRIASPWAWWTYAFFDLSWVWYRYRAQLDDGSAVGEAEAWARILGGLFVGLFVWKMRGRRVDARVGVGRFEARAGTVIGRGLRRVPEEVFVVCAIVASFGLWVASLCIAFRLTLPTIEPLRAVVMFGIYKTASFTFFLVLLGRLFCAPFSAICGKAGDGEAPLSSSKALAVTAAYTAADLVCLVLVFVALNLFSFDSIYAKAFALVPLGGLYALLAIYGLVQVITLWSQWGTAVYPDV